MKEIDTLKEHLHRVNMQFKKFKEIREIVSSSNGEVAAMQVDWSENVRVSQAKEARGAYYFEDRVAIHSICVDGNPTYQSVTALATMERPSGQACDQS